MAGVLLLSSCERKELPIKPHDPGNVTTATVSLGTPYIYQVYYNLRTNTVVGQNKKTDWDIACETSAEGYHIVLNSAKSMFAANTGKTDFAAVSAADTAGFALHKKWDAPSGSMDSTAIGDWRTSKPMYIVDKGYDQNGTWLGMEKLQILSVSDSGCTMRFATLSGTGDATVALKKDSAYNLAFASFTTGNQVMIEPPKDTWDLAFTQYTYIFYDYNPPLPYLVTGCLLNRYHTLAIKDTADQFKNITYTEAGSYKLSANISTIGYNWKTFTGTAYTINTTYNYIIQTSDGKYYKMYFTGYYNSTGVEGNPQWSYQQL